MTFVIDTVGEIELPDGCKCRGAILTVPTSVSHEQSKQAMRSAGQLWSERVVVVRPEQIRDVADFLDDVASIKPEISHSPDGDRAAVIDAETWEAFEDDAQRLRDLLLGLIPKECL